MSQRANLLAKALAVHQSYGEATDTLARLQRQNMADGPEWVDAFDRQQQALETWSKLSRAFEYFRASD
ncbi:hypothetical protein PFAS1_23155 [Pseudomonas frederiksbergensis]|nr:hypothetical protein PFAS1_23155 [Pseudomonas frederiksbergensis]